MTALAYRRGAGHEDVGGSGQRLGLGDGTSAWRVGSRVSVGRLGCGRRWWRSGWVAGWVRRLRVRVSGGIRVRRVRMRRVGVRWVASRIVRVGRTRWAGMLRVTRRIIRWWRTGWAGVRQITRGIVGWRRAGRARVSGITRRRLSGRRWGRRRDRSRAETARRVRLWIVAIAIVAPALNRSGSSRAHEGCDDQGGSAHID